MQIMISYLRTNLSVTNVRMGQKWERHRGIDYIDRIGWAIVRNGLLLLLLGSHMIYKIVRRDQLVKISMFTYLISFLIISCNKISR